MILSKSAMTIADKAIIVVLVVSLALGTFAPRLAEAAVLAFPFGVAFGWGFALWPRLFSNLRPDRGETGAPISIVAFAPMVAVGEAIRLATANGAVQLALVTLVAPLATVCAAGLVKELLDPGAITECLAGWWSKQGKEHTP